ncbi:MAG: hypothetical protein AMXMBFR4_35130 [Candidatus Hydrogenedentota bacterium]
MTMQREKLWLAYLDGELGAAEAAEFDQSLSQVEKEQLGAEIRLERGMAETLTRGGACPDDVWNRTLAALERRRAGNIEVLPAPKWMYGLTAVAAALAVVMTGIVFRMYTQPPSVLVLSEASVLQLAEKSDLKANTVEDVNAYLKDHGFDIALTSLDTESGVRHHERDFLGVHTAKNQGEDVIEMLFACCGKPIKVVIARAGGRTAREMGSFLADGKIQASRPVGDYVAAVVGRHKAAGLLEFLTEIEDADVKQAQVQST